VCRNPQFARPAARLGYVWRGGHLAGVDMAAVPVVMPTGGPGGLAVFAFPKPCPSTLKGNPTDLSHGTFDWIPSAGTRSKVSCRPDAVKVAMPPFLPPAP